MFHELFILFLENNACKQTIIFLILARKQETVPENKTIE